MPGNEALIATLKERLASLPWQERLRALTSAAPGSRIALSTSFSFEDQALTHVIAKEKLPIRLFTLDTGRLFEETHDTQKQTQEKYGLEIEIFKPEATAVENYIAKNGLNGFYESVENRKACCHIRKVEPLTRALKNTDIWISGLRREHSETRGTLEIAEWDAQHKLIKLYPLIDVSSDELWNFIRKNDVPYNALHDKGYPSIGCAPCTRAIKPGEPLRSGRWWWEQNSNQECGLHVVEGRLVRRKDGAHA